MGEDLDMLEAEADAEEPNDQVVEMINKKEWKWISSKCITTCFWF